MFSRVNKLSRHQLNVRSSLKADIHHLKPPQALKHPLCLTLNATARLPGSRNVASRQPEALNSAQ